MTKVYTHCNTLISEINQDKALERLNNSISYARDVLYEKIDKLILTPEKNMFTPKQGKLFFVICDNTTTENAVDMLIDIKKRVLGLIQSAYLIKDKIRHINSNENKFKEYVDKIISYLRPINKEYINDILAYLTLQNFEFEEKEYVQYINIKESDSLIDLVYDIVERLDEIIDLLCKARNKMYFDKKHEQVLRCPQRMPICRNYYTGEWYYLGYKTLSGAMRVSRNSSEWNLWHSYKNPAPLPSIIITSIIAIFIRSGWIIILLTWIWYWLFCKRNNKKLAEDPVIKKKREEFINYRKKEVITSDMVEYCKHYNIPIVYIEDK